VGGCFYGNDIRAMRRPATMAYPGPLPQPHTIHCHRALTRFVLLYYEKPEGLDTFRIL
jgi:hypothetical protein